MTSESGSAAPLLVSLACTGLTCRPLPPNGTQTDMLAASGERVACTWVGRTCRLILVRNGAAPTLEWWVIGSLAGPIPDRALFERCLLSLGTQPCSHNIHHNPPHDLSPPPSPPHYTTTSLHTFLDQSRTHCSLSILSTPSQLATFCTPSTQPRHLTILILVPRKFLGIIRSSSVQTSVKDFRQLPPGHSLCFSRSTLTLSLRPLLDLRGLFPIPNQYVPDTSSISHP
jgi:hypothetical protein